MKNKKWRRICQSKSSLEKQKTKFKEMNSLNWKFLEMDLIFRDFGEIWTISKEKEVEISSKWSRATGFWEQRRRHVHCLCFVFLFFCFLWMAHARTIVNFIPTQCTIQSETDMMICDNKSKNFVGNIAKSIQLNS